MSICWLPFSYSGHLLFLVYFKASQVEGNAMVVFSMIMYTCIHCYSDFKCYICLGQTAAEKNTLNKKEWMLRWKYFNFAPQNALRETGTWSKMSLRSAAELWAWHLALYLTLELLGLPSLPLKLILVLVHATLFREIQAALLQFKQWLKDSRSWMSSYWTTKRRQQEEEKNQSGTQSLSSLHSQSAHPVAKGKMQKWFSHSFEQILGHKVSPIPVPSNAGLP